MPRGESYFGKRRVQIPGIPPEVLDRIRKARDAEWSRAIGVCDKVLTPEEGADWLKADRVSRARNVAAESRHREVKHY